MTIPTQFTITFRCRSIQKKEFNKIALHFEYTSNETNERSLPTVGKTTGIFQKKDQIKPHKMEKTYKMLQCMQPGVHRENPSSNAFKDLQ